MILRSRKCLQYLKAIPQKICALKHRNLLCPNRIQSKCNIALRYTFSNDSRRSTSIKIDRQEYNQVSPLVQKLMNQLRELSSSENAENIKKRSHIAKKIQILEDELNLSQKIFILYDQIKLRQKHRFLNRLIHSLIDSIEYLSLNQLMRLALHIHKYRDISIKDKSKFILQTANRIFGIIEKKPQIILLNNDDFSTSSSSLQAQPFQNTEPIYSLTLSNLEAFIFVMYRPKKFTLEISSLINYILADNKNNSNLQKISQKQAIYIIECFTINSSKIYLLSEKIREAFTQDNFYINFDNFDYFKLTNCCRFVSLAIGDHRKSLVFEAEKEFLQKIQIEIQRLQKIKLRIVNEVLERLESNRKGSLSSSKYYSESQRRRTRQNLNQLGNRYASKRISSIVTSFSISKIFDESTWQRLLAAIEDNSNDRDILIDLSIILKYMLLMLKDIDISNNKKEFLSKNTKIVSKRIGRVYHLLSNQQTKDLQTKFNDGIFEQEILPYLSSKQHNSNSINEAKSQNSENSTKLASEKASREIELEEQTSQQEPIQLFQKNTPDGYVRILKSQLEEYQFLKDIAKQILQFEATESKLQKNEASNAWKKNERLNVQSQSKEDQKDRIEMNETKMKKEGKSRLKTIEQDWDIDLESLAAKKKQEIRKKKQQTRKKMA